MFHVKQKSYYKVMVIFISVTLVTSTVRECSLKSQAFLPAIPVLWEIVQTILLTVGATYLTYEAFQQIRDDGLYSESVDGIKEMLNAQDTGLGDAVVAAASDVEVTARGTKVVVSENVWNRLREVSKGIADSGTVSTNVNATISLNTPEDIVRRVDAVPLNYKPLLSDGHTHGNTTAFVDSNIQGWREFVEYASTISQSEKPLISAFYVVQSPGASGDYSCVAIATQNNIPIVSYEFTLANYQKPVGAQGASYAHFYDANGTEINYCAFALTWEMSVSAWNASVFDSSLKRVRQNWSWMEIPGVMTHSLGNNVPHIEPLILNSADGYAVPVTVNSLVRPNVIGGTYDVVTPGRTLTGEGAITGDIAITLPTAYPIADDIAGVIAGELPITDVLPKVDVVPVDTAQDKVIDGDKTISDAIADTIAPPLDIGGVGDFDLSLANFFPFCIPFDFVNLLQAFAAEPEAPIFTFDMPTGYNGNDFLWTQYTIDFSTYDTVAFWCRKGELTLYILGLLFTTREKFIRS